MAGVRLRGEAGARVRSRAVVQGDLGGSEGVGGPVIEPPADAPPALRTALGSHVDVPPVEVGVSARIEPPTPCVVVGAVGFLKVVVVPVLGGEHHSAVVRHGIRQIPGWPCEMDGVVALRTPQGEAVVDVAFAMFPVLQLDVQQRVSL